MDRYCRYVFLPCLLGCLWCCPVFTYAQPDYGLYIRSYPEIDSKKTSLVLENGQALALKKEMTLSFDLSARKDNIFGMVFRIITDHHDHIDFLFTANEQNQRYPILVVNDEVHIVSKAIFYDQWIPVRISLSKEKNTITLSYGKTVLTVPHVFGKVRQATVAFGLYPFAPFRMVDIAPVNIRNIKVYQNSELQRYWKLKEHNQDTVLDLIKQVPAVAHNPVWLVDRYATWDLLDTREIQDGSLFAFNQEDKFYIMQRDSSAIVVLDTKENQVSHLTITAGHMAANTTNQVYYDALKKRLVAYNLTDSSYTVFSFDDHRWTGIARPSDPVLMNNSSVYSPTDSSVYSFGGYSYYHYNNFLLQFSPFGKLYRKSVLHEITPRYAASSVIVGSTLYIFGGRGNQSGRQELSPRNYYDLYAIDLSTRRVKKLWETTFSTDFLPSENMVYDTQRRCFYVFTNLEGGTLIRIRPDHKGFEKVSFPIHENLEALYLYTNLYYSASQKKLFALVYKKKDEQHTLLSVYTMNFPPVSLTSLQQNEINQVRRGKSMAVYILASLFVLCLAGFFWKARRRHRSKGEISDDGFIRRSAEQASEPETVVKEEPFVDEPVHPLDFSKGSILLLGGFTVMDKAGNNIAGQFTPILKHLLVLLLLSTENEHKGISGRKLIQLLWPDKSEESAKNNRNVYLSRLRALVEQIGDISISNQNEMWTIKLGEEVQCDYLEVMHLFGEIHHDDAEAKEINRLLELLLRGELLPNIENDWMDGFKSNFSNQTIDFLLQLVNRSPYRESEQVKLKIADILFIHDQLNEEALYLKCSLLFDAGKKGIAKNVYDNFCKDYQQLLGIPFGKSFAEVVHENG